MDRVFPSALPALQLACAAALTVAIADPAQARDAPTILEQTTYYEVDAPTREGLLQQLAERGPGGYWGRVVWFVRFTSNCAVSVDIETTLPVHRGLEDMPDDLRLSWELMMSRLVAHEATHARHGKAAAREVKDKNCAGARWTIRKWANRDRAYDRRTQNGKLEGVTLP